MKLALLLLLAACDDVHHVTLLIGTSESELSGGFTCEDPDKAGHLLFERAIGSDGSLSFSMVVDFIDLGDQFPSCLAEDVAAACTTGDCHVSVADAPARFCATVSIDRGELAPDPEGAIRAKLAELAQVTSEAPHHPVIVRAVATMEPCAAITTPGATDWPTLERTSVLGCAYSCPVDLDDLNGTLQLGLNLDIKNASATQCQVAVGVCAVFPANASVSQ